MSEAAASGAWHVDTDSLRRWVNGAAGASVSVSVEAHLLHCAQCQAATAALVDLAPLEPTWDRVLTEIEVPRPGFVERLMVRLGATASEAVLIASAPTFGVAWVAGVIGVLAFTVLAAIFGQEGSVGLFLMAAPLIPVAGVAAAYGPSADPAYEVVVAAPFAVVRLVLLRSCSVLITAVPPAVVAGLLLPTSPFVAVAWLLPATGFVIVVLTASNWADPALAGGVVGAVWLVAVALAMRAGDPLVLLTPAALTGYLAVAAIATLVLLQRLLGAVPSWRLR